MSHELNHRLFLVRHGRTEWAATGRHTGHTDIPLDDVGRQQARALPGVLERLGATDFSAVVSSPLSRARDTAKLAGLEVTRLDDDLMEWDYGPYEGRTPAEIAADTGRTWNVFVDGADAGDAPGESVAEACARLDRAIARLREELEAGDVIAFGHGHALRTLACRWLGADMTLGGQLRLSPASVSVLCRAYGRPALQSWNIPSA